MIMFNQKKDIYELKLANSQKGRPFFEKHGISSILILLFIIIDIYCNFNMVDRLTDGVVYLSVILTFIIACILDITPAYLGVMSNDKDKERRRIFYAVMSGLLIFIVMLIGLRITSLYDSSTFSAVTSTNTSYTQESSVTFSTIIYNLILCIITIITSILSYFTAKSNGKKRKLDKKYLLEKENINLIAKIDALNQDIFELENDLKIDLYDKDEKQYRLIQQKTFDIYNILNEGYRFELAKKLNKPEVISKLCHRNVESIFNQEEKKGDTKNENN